jgi:peroxiredoxin (alkyl hydroperoxide reductase subunit C)
MIALLFCIATSMAWSQDLNNNRIPLIGDNAPSFTAESTNGQIIFPGDFGSKWKILFSHPADFTPVCSSELLELAALQPEFEKLNVKLAVLSTDALAQHRKWKESLESIDYHGAGKQEIRFPLVADENKMVSRQYGMIHDNTSNTKNVRGVFIIDPQNVVQAVYFYPMGVGRNMDEIKRTVVALQTAKNNVATPANWQPGDDVLLTHLTDEDKELKDASNPSIYELAWYMVFRKLQ